MHPELTQYLAQPWAERPREVAAGLRRFNLIKHDPDGRLPLASGGTTDLYVNLRDSRSDWRALDWLATQYACALELLDLELVRVGEKPVDALVDIPSAMSPVIGLVAVRRRKRIVTVRDQPKPGRVHAEYIGKAEAGDTAVILEDVITDGKSKLRPHAVLRGLGIEPLATMVLVDRDGWRASPGDTCFDGVPVWAGMSLAQLREALA